MLTPRFALALLLAPAALACTDPSAPPPAPEVRPQFISGGQPTGSTAYGNVGALMFDFSRNGSIEGDEQLCTGSLIAPTVFLTAAHCVAWLPATAQLFVTFDDNLLPAPTGLIAAVAFHHDPAYGHDRANLHDLAVVILPPGATAGITPLRLPRAGYLGERAARGGLVRTLFVNVGYGVSAARTGRPSNTWDGNRNTSKSPFMALQPYWLGLLMNAAATGEGGDCSGDSGSPKFVDGDPTMIVATVTWGDFVCRATSWDYRLDTDSARQFLGQFVTLP